MCSCCNEGKDTIQLSFLTSSKAMGRRDFDVSRSNMQGKTEYIRQRLSWLGSDGGCRFFGLFGCVLKVFLPNVLSVPMAGIFRGQEAELCLYSGAVCLDS